MSAEKERNDKYIVEGKLLYAESGRPASGLRVTLMDADPQIDDELGEAMSNEEGKFRIAYHTAQFDDMTERAPDLYVLVYDKDNNLVANTKDSLIFDAKQREAITVQIPGSEDQPITRTQFTKLLLGNPNYFGNMPELDFEPVVPQSGNTDYEQLVCLGLHPQGERLEAVVHIKRAYGYRTDACGQGSPEYVRFFVEDSGGWRDLGVTSFTSYDMPGSDLPLSYSLSTSLDELRRTCTSPKLLRVRAILSWNQEPPAGNANWPPPWGNVLDATVQIAPWDLKLVKVSDLIESQQLVLNEALLANLNLNQTLDTIEPQAMSYAQLKELYAEADVPAHRFAYRDALNLVDQPISSKILANLQVGKDLQALLPGPELADILGKLDVTIGNRTYEELTCAGYNPGTRTMSGVISIKRSSGYLGGLCSPGSTEYVGFWVRYDGSWHALGQAEVQVHDLPGVDSDNTIEYAVFRAVNMLEMPCEDLTGLPLRAILSWNKPPTGPTYSPDWGNVVNTYIQPNIGEGVPEDKNRLRLLRVGRVTTNGINASGLAENGGSLYVSGDCLGNKSPFAGSIRIEGDFVHKLDVFNHNTGDVLPGTHPLLYQVFVQETGLPATRAQLKNSFTIAVTPQNGSLPITKSQSIQPVGADEYYTYMESNTQVVNPRTLAVWQAGGLDQGNYTIEVIGFAYDGVNYNQISSQTQDVYVYNGYPHIELAPGGGTINVRRPRVHIQINPPGSDCGDFIVGDVIKGTYSVTDNFFGRLRVRVVPITVGGIPQPINPISIDDSGVPQPNPVEFEQTAQADTNGMSGTWTLNTAGMTACGYTIQLWSRDRALVSSSCSGHYNETGVGFCLREPD